MAASQSLNRYSYVQGNPVSYTDPFGLSPLNGLFTGTNFWHAVLGFIGCVPGPVGMVANLEDAAVYALIDHDYGMAALAMLDCVSGGLSTLAKAASAAGKATKSARYLKTAGSLISNVSSFAQNASAGMATAFDMYEKYMIKGEKFDSSTPWEIASLGLSIVGMGISGRGMAGDTKALSKMLNEDMISSRMRNAVMEFAADRGCENLEAFKGGTATINPNDIRFSQSSVNGASEIIDSMKAKGWDGDSIDVVRMSDSNLTTIDNTRVLAARYAGIDVQANVHAFDEMLPQDLDLIERLTTPKGVPQTWGDAVLLRIGKQNSGYRNTYPLGSNIIGWSGN